MVQQLVLFLQARLPSQCVVVRASTLGKAQGMPGHLDPWSVYAAEMKPTLFIGVPRVFDRIYAGVQAKINSGGAVKKFLFNYGYRWKLSYMSQGHKFDQVLFSPSRVNPLYICEFCKPFQNLKKNSQQ